MEPRALLYRRLGLWILVALAFAESLALSTMANVLAQYLHRVFNGKPLPVLAQFLCDAGWRYLLFPSLAFYIVLAFTLWKKPSQDQTLFIAISIVACILFILFTFFIGAVSPFVVVHYMQQE